MDQGKSLPSCHESVQSCRLWKCTWVAQLFVLFKSASPPLFLSLTHIDLLRQLHGNFRTKKHI